MPGRPDPADRADPMDAALLTWLNQDIAHPILDALMAALSVIGFALLPGMVLGFLMLGRRRTGAALLAAILAGCILAVLFQQISLRQRPTGVRLLLASPDLPGFPSGHAAAAFGGALLLGLVFRRRWIWIGGLLLAGLIGVSRVYLGHHFPSDVLAGGILGAGIGAACYGLIFQGWNRVSGWRWLMWLQLSLVIMISFMAYLDLLPPVPWLWKPTDKLLHFLIYGSITLGVHLWIPHRRIVILGRSLPLTLAVLAPIFTLEELAQGLSGFRGVELGDLTSNLLGLVIFWQIGRRLLSSDRLQPISPAKKFHSRQRPHA